LRKPTAILTHDTSINGPMHSIGICIFSFKAAAEKSKSSKLSARPIRLLIFAPRVSEVGLAAI
jgi:hypothetical protein